MMKAINPNQHADYLFFIEIRQNFFEADIQEVVLAGYFAYKNQFKLVEQILSFQNGYLCVATSVDYLKDKYVLEAYLYFLDAHGEKIFSHAFSILDFNYKNKEFKMQLNDFDKPLRKELLQDADFMMKLKKQHIKLGGWKR